MDMHERKAKMASEAEAFIALPGNNLEFYSSVLCFPTLTYRATFWCHEYRRRIWNYGRAIGNDNMGTTWNSQKTGEAVAQAAQL